MARRGAEEYGDHYEESWPETGWEPAVRYDPERFPDVAEALDALNGVALMDERSACVRYPDGDREAHGQAVSYLGERRAGEHGLSVISFDIDLTVRTGEDFEEDVILVDPETVGKLQAMGYIVGTCSDREPSDQRKVMEELGQNPGFCIPKEMLGWARELLPGEIHIHVGDDPERDRNLAGRAGWSHLWPHEFVEMRGTEETR